MRFCCLKPIVFSSFPEATSLSNLALSQKEFLRKKAGQQRWLIFKEFSW
jgi:hypothetical protein